MKTRARIRRKKLFFACVSLLLLAAVGYGMLTNGYDYFMKKIYPIEYRELVEQAAAENNLDQALVYAMIKAESDFNPNARSHAGAVGLMQITPPTFEWLQTKLKSDTVLTEDDLLVPETNIRYGCHFLSILLNMYSEQKTAICAYNAGIGTVNRWLADSGISADGENLDRIPYPETDQYSTAVLKNYQIYKKLYHF